MRGLKTIIKWSLATLLVIAFVIAIIVVLSRMKPFEKMPYIGGYKPMVVLGGSMEPAIRIGSVVIVSNVDPKSIKIGDVITFKTPTGNGLQVNKKDSLTTHRVISIEPNGAAMSFVTKGDANHTKDSWTVAEKDVLGRAAFTLPYLGYFSNYVKTPMGFLIFLVLPGLVIIALEIRNIVKELKSVQVVSDAKETG